MRIQQLSQIWRVKTFSLPLIFGQTIDGLHITSPKHDYANCDQFAPNFDVACKTIQCVAVPNLNLIGPMNTELWAKEVGEFSVTLFGKMGWWAFFCPPSWLPQYKCMEIF